MRICSLDNGLINKMTKKRENLNFSRMKNKKKET